MIKGVHFVRKKRRGKPDRWYVYAWRGGPLIHSADGVQKPPLGKAEIAALAAAQAEARQPNGATLAGAIQSWRISPDWARLAKSTKQTWGVALDGIEAKWGTVPLTVFEDPRMTAKIVDWRDSRSETPRAADIGVTVLKAFLKWCRLKGKLRINVAEGIPPLYSSGGRAEIVWTEGDIERFSASAIALNRSLVIDALKLAALTGFRRADLVSLTWAEVGDSAIIRMAQKKSRGRRRRAVIPILPALEELLQELRERKRQPGVQTVIVNSQGRPWTGGSLTQAFNQVRDHAGIVHPGDPRLETQDRAKHLHDVRGTFVTHLCRRGLSDQEVADLVAWSPQNVAHIRRTYVDEAATVVALSRRLRQAL